MSQPPTISFPGSKIVIAPEQYGRYYCFHIDPGTGETLPIYFEDNASRDRLVRKVRKLLRSRVDVAIVEVPYGEGELSGVRRYLKRIKESNARK